MTEQTKSERIAECEENLLAIRDEIDSLESELNTANQNLDDYGQYAVAHETSEIKAIIRELRTDIQEQKSDLAKWESELELAQAMSDDELQAEETHEVALKQVRDTFSSKTIANPHSRINATKMYRRLTGLSLRESSRAIRTCQTLEESQS